MTRRYNQWAGNEKGTPEDRRRCVVQVRVANTWMHRQCNSLRGQGPADEYCRRHAKALEQGKHLWVPEEQ